MCWWCRLAPDSGQIGAGVGVGGGREDFLGAAFFDDCARSISDPEDAEVIGHAAGLS